MPLNIKTLAREEFQIECSPSDTVAQLKSKIETNKTHPVAAQRLLFRGKVLEDDRTLESYEIVCSGNAAEFLVLVVSKTAPKPAATPAVATPPPVSTSPAPTPAPAPAASPSPAPASSGATPSSTSAPSSGASGGESSSLVTGSDFENTVNNLMEMGFGRDECIRALRAAFNNPYRAVEYLTNGIPRGLENAGATPAAGGGARAAAPSRTTAAPAGAGAGATAGAGAGAATGGAAASAPAAGGNLFQMAQQQYQSGGRSGGAAPAAGGAAAGAGGGSGTFDFLRNHPQFNALRLLVQQQPALLEPVLAQLAQQNPQILQLIQQHQAEFSALLNEPVDPAQAAAIMSQLGGGGGGGGAPPGSQYIQVTPAEKAALDRLQEMGFPRRQVVEAFLACDKNEELAANFLLQNGVEKFDDDDGGDGDDDDDDDTGTSGGF